MKIKTSELKDLALDWAVVRANYEINFEEVWRNFRNECGYSYDWAQGGPIIEREEIAVRRTYEDTGWTASKATAPHFMTVFEDGPTPLIAAMRCYVASRLGDEVEVPDSIGGAA
jgi:hypothetical protein